MRRRRSFVKKIKTEFDTKGISIVLATMLILGMFPAQLLATGNEPKETQESQETQEPQESQGIKEKEETEESQENMSTLATLETGSIAGVLWLDTDSNGLREPSANNEDSPANSSACLPGTCENPENCECKEADDHDHDDHTLVGCCGELLDISEDLIQPIDYDELLLSIIDAAGNLPTKAAINSMTENEVYYVVSTLLGDIFCMLEKYREAATEEQLALLETDAIRQAEEHCRDLLDFIRYEYFGMPRPGEIVFTPFSLATATTINISFGRVIINGTMYSQYVGASNTVYTTGTNSAYEYRLTGTVTLTLPTTLNGVVVRGFPTTTHLYFDNLNITINAESTNSLGKAVNVTGANVTITLVNGTTNTLTANSIAPSGFGRGGALVKNNALGGHRLTIQCESADIPGHLCSEGFCGKLNAIGTGGHATAIGSERESEYTSTTGFANLYIKGGIIVAQGGLHSPGIGSMCATAFNRDGFINHTNPMAADGQICTNINITGGRVYAYGGEACAGIGSGAGGPVDGIYISGGAYVYAQGGQNSPGIGSGGTSSTVQVTWPGAFTVNNIVISGGLTVVEAVGNNVGNDPASVRMFGIDCGANWWDNGSKKTPTNVFSQPDAGWNAIIKQGTSKATATYNANTPSPVQVTISTDNFYNLFYFAHIWKTAQVNGGIYNIGTLTDPVMVKPGDEVKYTINVEMGENDDRGLPFSIQDDIPAGMTLVTTAGSYSSGMEWSQDGTTWTSGAHSDATVVRWANLTDFQTVFFTVTIDGGTIPPFDYLNRAAQRYDAYPDKPLYTNYTYHRVPEILLVFSNITITKTVTGDMGDKNKTFEFTLTLRDSAGALLSGTTPFAAEGHIVTAPGQTPLSSDNITLTNGQAKFYLKHDQSITFKDVPEDFWIQVVETEVALYEVSVTDSITAPNIKVSAANTRDTGVRVVGDVARTFTYTNDRESVPETGISMDSSGTNGTALMACTLVGTLGLLALPTVLRRRLGKHRYIHCTPSCGQFPPAPSAQTPTLLQVVPPLARTDLEEIDPQSVVQAINRHFPGKQGIST